MTVITIERRVLEKNDELARRNREDLGNAGVHCLNLLSSPGAGKTSLLEASLSRLGVSLRLAVIEGDVQTDLDARRVARYGVPVVQLVTNGACHLEARLVGDAMREIDLRSIDLLVIENVGNLVCPAGFDLGENEKVVVASVTEGDDKPLKYPAMFRNASALVINKIDLLPHLPCDLGTLRRNALAINPDLEVFELSALTGAGLDAWCTWLLRRGGK